MNARVSDDKQVALRSTPRGWLEARERGSELAIRGLIRWVELFGRRAGFLPLHSIAAYYTLFDRRLRHSSATYLRRIDGHASWGRVYDHVHTFAQTVLDRLFLLRGRYDLFEVTCNGIEHLERMHRAGQGALLLGAHLGSFDAMRLVGTQQAFKIRILVHFANARRINRFLARFAPDFAHGIIEIDPENPSYIFAVKEALDAGEFVALLGDRVGINERAAAVEFLGAKTLLPTGPFALASVLGCPVYLTFGLYSPPNRYDLYCEPFAETIALPRGDKAAALATWAQRYAARLEVYCRKAPLNWFNFFDYWAAV